MKKIIILIVLFILSTSISFSYNLNQNDLNIINKVKLILQEYSKTKPKEWFDLRIQKIDKISVKYKNNIRIWLILNQIKTELKNISNSYDNNNLDINNIPDYKTTFFQENGKNIVYSIELREGCTKYFDFIDEIAKRNDFPTALIIATWSKEFNCQLSNPANGWGPFQITSKYYEPGEITLDDFGISIQNFIDFSKGKWSYFETNSDYKNRFGEEKINLTYDYYTLRDLRLHSVLYNGIHKNTNLEDNEFANGNLNENIISNTDGIITLFLKVLNWQIENNK